MAKSDGLEINFARVIADGDLVAVHSRLARWAPEPVIAMDVIRVQDGKIVEHWDVITPTPSSDASNNDAGKFQADPRLGTLPSRTTRSRL